MDKLKIAVASDHAGYEMKNKLKKYLESEGYEIHDFGSYSSDSADYPDFGHPLAEAVSNEEFKFGISLCGSGNGINIVANKHPLIRSALCWNKEIAELARKHNNANVCALPARFITFELAKEITDAFLITKFEGGRHERRIEKIPITH